MESGETWRLGWRPQLDGLRGCAVLLVVASHLTTTSGFIRSLGPVGVSVFFTLSGFLITALLLEERARRGRVDLRRFYRRRFLRLAPAMAACVGAVVVVGLVTGASDAVAWPMVLGSLTYSANWVAMVGAGSGSALGHMWSLAIEEQFYLVWPLMLIALLRGGRRSLVLGIGFGITLSLLLTVALWPDGWERVYYGSDTRASGLLFGCVLAVAVHGRPPPRLPAAAASVASVAMVATALAPLELVFVLGPAATSVLTVVVILSAVGRDAPRWLAWRPLALVGQRSYGLYVWHYPVVIAATALLGGSTTTGWLVATVVPASAVLTVLSWRFVESPFLRLREAATDDTRQPALAPRLVG